MVSTSPGDINASASRGFIPHEHGILPIFSNDGSPNPKFHLQNSLHLPEGVVAKNSLQYGGEEGRSRAKPLSFKQVVQNERIIPQGAAFISDVTKEVSANKGDGGNVSIPSILVIKPNSQMNEVIDLEKAKLQDCAIFFAAVDSSRVPSRNLFNDWFHKVWGKKLGFHFTYCCMLQKGLFILSCCDNKTQKAIVDKKIWRVGSCEFRAIPWTLEATQDEVLALSSTRWIILGNLPPFLLTLIPQALEPLGKVLRIDQSNTLIPNTDVRILISLKPGVDLPESLQFDIDTTPVCCPITFLGGLGGCFVCRKEGHKEQECSIILKRNAIKKKVVPKTGFDNTSSSVEPPLSSNKTSVPSVNISPLENWNQNPKLLSATLDKLKEKFESPPEKPITIPAFEKLQ